MYHLMPSTASVRDLRNHFPKVKKIVEEEGSVILTERGKPTYRLTPCRDVRRKLVKPVDFWERLNARQPRQLSAAVVDSLNEENRGDR
jgi:prevent-host-death family protein